MDIPLTATGATEDRMDCVDKCVFEHPLSLDDIACLQAKECSDLSTSVRSMRPGECSD